MLLNKVHARVTKTTPICQTLNYAPNQTLKADNGYAIFLSDANTKTIGGEICIRSYLPKLINKTDDDVMDKVATHSYQGLLSISKGLRLEIIAKVETNWTVMYITFAQTENFFQLFF